MTTFSYLRVSTKEQTIENQRMVIADAGFSVAKEYFDEGVSGGVKALERKGFSSMMKAVVSGDTVICTMVDRLGRNAGDILHTIEEFKRLGVKVRILQFDGIDVTSSMGKMVITVMAALAEMEKSILVERTVAGLARTKAEGTILGAPNKVAPDVVSRLVSMKTSGMTLDQITAETGIPRNSVARYVRGMKTGAQLEVYAEKYNTGKSQYVVNAEKRQKRVDIHHSVG